MRWCRKNLRCHLFYSSRKERILPEPVFIKQVMTSVSVKKKMSKMWSPLRSAVNIKVKKLNVFNHILTVVVIEFQTLVLRLDTYRPWSCAVWDVILPLVIFVLWKTYLKPPVTNLVQYTALTFDSVAIQLLGVKRNFYTCGFNNCLPCRLGWYIRTAWHKAVSSSPYMIQLLGHTDVWTNQTSLITVTLLHLRD